MQLCESIPTAVELDFVLPSLRSGSEIDVGTIEQGRLVIYEGRRGSSGGDAESISFAADGSGEESTGWDGEGAEEGAK